jgi:hypothetical protein
MRLYLMNVRTTTVLEGHLGGGVGQVDYNRQLDEVADEEDLGETLEAFCQGRVVTPSI